MRYQLTFSFFMSLASLSILGCGEPAAEASSGKWEGETPHFSARGTINGEDVEFSIAGDDAAMGSRAWCGREYIAPPAAGGGLDLTQAQQEATEIAGYATINGEERSFELELRNFVFAPEQAGSTVRVVPRVEGVDPGEGAVWVDWEWHSADGSEDLYEASAQDGTFEVGLYTGTAGEGGVVIPAGDGSFGGLLKARWSLDESLTISFTMPCVSSNVEGQ